MTLIVFLLLDGRGGDWIMRYIWNPPFTRLKIIRSRHYCWKRNGVAMKVAVGLVMTER